MNEILELFSRATGIFNLFFAYFFAGLLFVGVYFYAYTRITKYDEMELIRHGNMAAAYSLVGSLLGFSLPLSMAIVHTASAQSFAFWALVSMVTQIATYYFLKLAFKDVDAQIEANNPAYGVLDGGLAIVVGIVNAACVV
jgi:putative membrane protein